MADRLTNEQMHALLDAWERWDDRPAERERVVAYEDALKDAAAALDCTTLQLRTGLGISNRTAQSRSAALAAFRKALAASD